MIAHVPDLKKPVELTAGQRPSVRESRDSFATQATYDANVEGRFSMERMERESFGPRGTISERSSFNKKNLSIMLPPDDPGTEINPNWKTPVIEKMEKVMNKPAISPVVV